MNTKKIMLDYLSNKINSKEIAEITGKDHKEVINVLREFSQAWENTQHDTNNSMSLKETELIQRYAKRIDNL